ncbi:hypothetical protein MKEN_01449700 [Mycena kentingensis (nom. inval.)]|nr:hypothetical protein MKEN_01449700 [Mycena kentingensis (nom. inval.)]
MSAFNDSNSRRATGGRVYYPAAQRPNTRCTTTDAESTPETEAEEQHGESHTLSAMGDISMSEPLYIPSATSARFYTEMLATSSTPRRRARDEYSSSQGSVSRLRRPAPPGRRASASASSREYTRTTSRSSSRAVAVFSGLGTEPQVETQSPDEARDADERFLELLRTRTLMYLPREREKLTGSQRERLEALARDASNTIGRRVTRRAAIPSWE